MNKRYAQILERIKKAGTKDPEYSPSLLILLLARSFHRLSREELCVLIEQLATIDKRLKSPTEMAKYTINKKHSPLYARLSRNSRTVHEEMAVEASVCCFGILDKMYDVKDLFLY